ncbi:hypothetical protein [Bacterioplanoides sp.]|uniref:FG-GAP repeat protein n=1 Tax=Bacterioplanoides sp. TaxID=2066072 RepID=UPI003B00DAFA
MKSYTQHLLIILAGLFLSSCGGGGGNSETPSPENNITVSTQVTGPGSIAPTSSTKSLGEIVEFTLSPADGYKINLVSGCDGNLEGNIYSTSELTGNCSVQVSFSPAFYELTTQTDGNGVFEFERVQVIGQANLTITPNPGFIIDQVIGCGGTLNGNIYTTSFLTEDCLVSATFKKASILEMSAKDSKTLLLSWGETPNAVHYNLLISTIAESSFLPIATQIEKNIGQYEYSTPLHLTSDIRFKLEICTSDNCIDSNIVSFDKSYSEVITYIKASNPDTLDRFGNKIALSADGNTLAVSSITEQSNAKGINGDQNDNSINNAGAVYVFSRGNSGWQQDAYIKASNTDEWDVFGYSIALNSDGSMLVVGAPQEDSGSTQVNGDQEDNSRSRIGAAYVFKQTNKVWEQQAYLKPSQLPPIGHRLEFGKAVSINSAGDQIAVGSIWGRTGSITGGVVHVFEYENNSWIETHTLSASNTDSSDQFGTSVKMSDDGKTIAIGAPYESSSGQNPSDNLLRESGAVYIFNKSNSTWNQTAYLKADHPIKDSLFGSNISLSGDGTTLSVGVPDESSTGENNPSSTSLSRSGAVYIFKSLNNTWDQIQLLKSENKEQLDVFGMSVSLNQNGDILAVGAPGEGGGDSGFNGDQSSNSIDSSGAAYIFSYQNERFIQKTYIKSKKAITETGIGSQISISADGETMAVGVPFDDSRASGINGNPEERENRNSGAVLIY